MPETAEFLRTLCLCDLGAVPKLGLKGAGAEAWLRGQGVDVPPGTYETRRLADGGLTVRLGASDFFFEAGAGDALSRLSAELDRGAPRAYRVERQDVTFLLAGSRAIKVLAQLCSIDFRSVPLDQLILTRAGGVNCGVLPGALGEVPLFRLWVDPTYATSFWETLMPISEELGGQVVGVDSLPPELMPRKGHI